MEDIKNGILGVLALMTLMTSCSQSPQSPEIVVQDLQMVVPTGERVFSEKLLENEIADTEITHFALTGPIEYQVSRVENQVNMFLFVKGNGTLLSDSLTFNLVPESIAIPINAKDSLKIAVEDGQTLHYVLFTKKLTDQDIEDLSNFPTENQYDVFFTRFEDCEPYTEKIKSPNTVSRTVLPADIVPRVSLGTVEAMGPDEVGAHSHAMLDQLFLGLANNDIVVYADDASTEFKEYSLLHIPIGSSHWVTVGEDQKMYYMWMDFFLTKEGQEWLKTHKPMSSSDGTSE